jgi:hypothetical protein
MPSLQATVKTIAHDAVTGAAQDLAAIGTAFAKNVIPMLTGDAAIQVKSLLAGVAQDALQLAKTTAADAAASLMVRASQAVENAITLVKSKIAVPASVSAIIQAALSLLPAVKTSLGMVVPPMADGMSPDQARAVLRAAAA